MEAEAYEYEELDYSNPNLKSGAEMVISTLKMEGVDVVFGYPGGAVIPIYDALYDSGLKHVLARHEQGAIHAADAYARASGKVGVCIATSGPGATNLVTGITNAYMDSIPLLVITGQVSSSLIGTDAFQEADITGITMPITKHNYLVKDVKELPKIIVEAMYLARSGRPGPVLIDIPKDISYERAKFSYPEEINIPSYQPTANPNQNQVAKVARVIELANRPIILAGGGVISANASEELFELVEMMNIPVTNTLMGLGSIQATHPLFLGMLGMHGTVPANKAIQNADLIISLGARFDDRVTGKVESFAPKAKIIHIDIDPAELGKIIPTQLPLVGDIKLTLKALLKELKPGDTKEWLLTIKQWKKDKPLRYKDTGETIKPQYVIQTISKRVKEEVIVATDVGQHQMWTAQYFSFNQPRSFITSGGLGTMGFGLPAAVGAQFANREAQVVCITGDGSIQMNIQELATIKEQNLPIKIIILNNGYLGMVRQWQELFHDKRYSSTPMVAPDFVKLAEAYGILGLRAKTKDEANEVIEEGLQHEGPVVIEFLVEKEENVYPFVPALASLDEMIEEGTNE